MAQRFVNPFIRYLTDGIKPLTAGKLFFFETNSNTPKDTFKDSNGNIANTNPVILTDSGEAPQIWTEGSYKLVMTDLNGVQINEIEPYPGDTGTSPWQEWLASVVYSIGDIVKGSDGEYYSSLCDNNLSLDPIEVANANCWERIELWVHWNEFKTYNEGDLVIGSDNDIYVSVAGTNLANDPIIDEQDFWIRKTIKEINYTSAAMFAFLNF